MRTTKSKEIVTLPEVGALVWLGFAPQRATGAGPPLAQKKVRAVAAANGDRAGVICVDGWQICGGEAAGRESG